MACTCREHLYHDGIGSQKLSPRKTVWRTEPDERLFLCDACARARTSRDQWRQAKRVSATSYSKRTRR